MYASSIRQNSFFVITLLLGVLLASVLCAATPAYAANDKSGDLATAAIAKSGISTMAGKGFLDAYAVYGLDWNGKKVKPKVYVEYGYWNGKDYSWKTLKAGRDYKLKYPTSTASGQHIVQVTGKGKYAGLKTKAAYYISPHTRKITSYKKSGKTLKVNWRTYPDKTNYYLFSFAPTASEAKENTFGYLCSIFDKGSTPIVGKWCYGRCISNKTIKSKWGAGHAKLSLKKYLSKNYKKKYVYVSIAAVKTFKSKVDFDGYPALTSNPTVKKIILRK